MLQHPWPCRNGQGTNQFSLIRWALALLPCAAESSPASSQLSFRTHGGPTLSVPLPVTLYSPGNELLSRTKASRRSSILPGLEEVSAELSALSMALPCCCS